MRAELAADFSGRDAEDAGAQEEKAYQTIV